MNKNKKMWLKFEKIGVQIYEKIYKNKKCQNLEKGAKIVKMWHWIFF